jgi:16S rRNA (cytidine1402-2'-O)-methyltransferase
MANPSDSNRPSKPGAGKPEAARPGPAGSHQTKRGELGLVATPIGNLGDMSVRALDYLKKADLIACEDSRVTGNLTRHFGISTPLLPYHEHNAERMRPKLLARLRQGARLALVSDAGTPLVSDPGFKLVRACRDEGIKVTGLPGASAPILALVLSGLPCDRFLFLGFLPAKSAARRREIAELAQVQAALILFEGPSRLAATLADLGAVLGNRPAAIARELTKIHEEIRRAPLLELAAIYASEGPPKGEIVIVVAPPDKNIPAPDASALDAALLEALATLALKDAAGLVSAQLGLPKRAVYQRALELKRGARDAKD